MLTRTEEEGGDDDSRSSAPDAATIRRRDRRLGQLHMRRLDNCITLGETLRKLLRDFLEHSIALRAARAVIDDDHAGRDAAFIGAVIHAESTSNRAPQAWRGDQPFVP